MSDATLTERLRLEPITRAHVDDLVRLHAAPEVIQWHAGAWTRARAEEFADSCTLRRASDGASKWIAYARDDDRLVGRGGLSRDVIDGAWRWEVGWTLLPEAWGHGYATEIGHAALQCAFDTLGAEEVVAFTELENARSLAVMTRLGMHDRRSIAHDGETFELCSISSDEFRRGLRRASPTPPAR
jgi:RimJ/RimL family protein N-acetyltransferase